MKKLLMISGKGATDTALGKKNAFYNTLTELRTHFERIDIVCPQISNFKFQISNEFSNVFFHLEVPDRKFDIMTVHEYAPFSNGRLANKIWEKTKTPMIFEIMHIPGMPKAGSWKERVAKLVTRFYIAHDVCHASAVRVINNQVGDWLIRAGVPKDKIKLIPAMYIDLDIFKPMNLEKKYDMIFVGRRAKNKGIELFEKAGRGFKTLIVDGWAKDSQEIAHLLNQSKLLIMSSYNEGGPRVVLEALACGIPVLATPVGIVPEVLPKEWIIDWNADNIAQKARKILSENAIVPKIDWSNFEKKSTIKNYAEFINSYTRIQT